MKQAGDAGSHASSLEAERSQGAPSRTVEIREFTALKAFAVLDDNFVARFDCHGSGATARNGMALDARGKKWQTGQQHAAGAPDGFPLPSCSRNLLRHSGLLRYLADIALQGVVHRLQPGFAVKRRHVAGAGGTEALVAVG